MTSPYKRCGFAFPTQQLVNPDGFWNQTYDPGMTLWHYFAAHAPQPDRAITSPYVAVDYVTEFADAMI
ncbi:MAG TPA: hypothetical protein ENH82_18145, partial [bacterium]|nr:hypothetical protein [bacterium]